MSLCYFQGATEDAGRMGCVLVIAGMMGSLFFGILLDRNHKYKCVHFYYNQEIFLVQSQFVQYKQIGLEKTQYSLLFKFRVMQTKSYKENLSFTIHNNVLTGSSEDLRSYFKFILILKSFQDNYRFVEEEWKIMNYKINVVSNSNNSTDYIIFLFQMLNHKNYLYKL